MADNLIYQEDLIFLQASIPELQAYMLSKEVFWPVYYGNHNSLTSISKLTLGNLYLAFERLQALALPDPIALELEMLDQHFQDFHSQWKANLMKKGTDEIAARINLWNNYLREIDKRGFFNHSEYANNVRWRVIVQLLTDNEVPISSSAREQMRICDSYLKKNFHTSDFVWQEPYSNKFGPEKFWYLYVTLSQDKSVKL